MDQLNYYDLENILSKDKYPDSSIKLFKEIGAHMSGRVIQKMLLKDNDKVKFIGVLKKV